MLSLTQAGRALAAAVAASLVASCSIGDAGGAPGGPGPPSVDPPIFSPGTGCRNAADAIQEVGLRKPGKLSGDVDGDGTRDEVRLVIDESAVPGCAAFVVVETRGRVLAAAIAEQEISFELGLPALNSLAEIDQRPGSEVVVDTIVGASTQFAGVFTTDEGMLMRVSTEGLAQPDLFAYGGSVAHLAAADCADGGRVVVSNATPQGAGYLVERVYLRTRGTTWKVDNALTRRSRVSLRELASRPEFARAPFSGC